MKNIIVEGPDGSGKSTLIAHLQESLGLPLHEKASTSKGGPIDDLWAWVETDLIPMRAAIHNTFPAHIYDRHPVISEPIYGPIVRKSVREYFDDLTFIRRVTNQIHETCIVVWCLTDLGTVTQNVFANAKEQMPGVTLNIAKVHQAYMTAYFRWRGPKRQYDYRRHDKSWFTDELKRMINE